MEVKDRFNEQGTRYLEQIARLGEMFTTCNPLELLMACQLFVTLNDYFFETFPLLMEAYPLLMEPYPKPGELPVLPCQYFREMGATCVCNPTQQMAKTTARLWEQAVRFREVSFQFFGRWNRILILQGSLQALIEEEASIERAAKRN